MAKPTEANEAARIAKALTGEFKAAFDRILIDHKVSDWQLQAFSLTRRAALESAEGCNSGEEYDCRLVGTTVVCKCFPKL
jgi:hypothetical protein